MRARGWLIAALAMLLGRRRRREDDAGRPGDAGASGPSGASGASDGPIIPPGTPDRGAENLVLAFLALATLAAIGFVVVYAAFTAPELPDQLLGICLGVSLVSIGAALTVVARRLVVTEELEDDYPEAHPDQQAEIVEMVHESGSRITRKRLLLGAGATAGGALTVAALTPVLSIGPIWDTAPLEQTPWYRGRRVVDENSRPIAAADVLRDTFYTAFPEGANFEDLGSPLVIIRLDPAKLDLPPGRSGWTPGGILAFSKICTHAGCAIGLYRKPTFPIAEPESALVCPCHYSTFDPYTGGKVIFGPAGRPLPQLPLMVDPEGHLRSAGNFSARVGPSWWAVRFHPSTGSE